MMKILAEFCHPDEGRIAQETPHRESSIFVEVQV